MGEPLSPETITFTREDAGTTNVWFVDADGSNRRALTAEVAVRAQLATIAPDRRTIAYTAKDGEAWDLYLVDPRNEGRIRVARGLAADARATWSPDGRQLAFVSAQDGRPDLVALDLRTNRTRKLTDNPGTEGDPAWSPDGTRIVFWAADDLYTVPAGGGPLTRLTIAEGPEADPSWSPDGTRIAYAAKPPGGSTDIWVAGADGADPRPLEPGGASPVGDEEDPTWSPDGRRISFEARHMPDAANPGTDAPEIYVVNADGTAPPVRLTPPGGVERHPAWSGAAPADAVGGIAAAVTPPADAPAGSSAPPPSDGPPAGLLARPRP
jgi:Tol biopolymer transport system component